MINPEINRLARRLLELEDRTRRPNTPQLANSAIMGRVGIEQVDDEGNLIQIMGEQPDGSIGIQQYNGALPPAPSMPTVEATMGSARVMWDGEWEDDQITPMDLVRVDVHILTDAEQDPLEVPSSGSIVAAGWGGTSLTLEPGEYFAVLVAWTTSGQFTQSEVSDPFEVLAIQSGSDGEPPATAPVVTVEPFGIGGVRVTWDTVENADPVTYAIHASLISGFTAGPTNLVDRTPGLSSLFDSIGGTSLPAVPVYVKVIASDEDGEGPVSAQATATPTRITAPDLDIGIITADMIANGAVLESKIAPVVVGKITTAQDDATAAGQAASVADGKAVTAQGAANTADGKAVTAQQTADSKASPADVAQAKIEALDGAAIVAQQKADTAKSDAEQAAALDATSKADTAKSEALQEAAVVAQQKADQAKSDAEDAAALDATSKADTAKLEALQEAAVVAQQKADQAKSDAEQAAALDATSKADTAKLEALQEAAVVAQQKADQAKDDAKLYTDQEVSDVSSAAATAQTQANDALSAAQLAQATADGAIRTFYQATAPDDLNDDTHLGDLWFDTATNQAHRWSGSQNSGWILIQDNSIADALSAAQSAQTTADGKITSWYQNGAPTGPAVSKGDLWFKTNDDNKPHYYDGAAWLPVRDGTIAIAKQAADDAALAASLADGKAIVADGKAIAAAVAAATADGKAVTADGKAVTAQQAAATADGKAVTADGKAVTAQQAASVADGKAVTADGKAVTAQQAASVADGKAVTADGKAVTAGQAASVADGKAVTADGKAVTADGKAVAAANAAATADGKAVTADGKAVAAGQAAGVADGKAVAAAVAAATADGKAVSANANALSRGNNLVTNGTGYLKDNTNFPQFTFVSSDAPPGAVGSFETALGGPFLTEGIPVDVNKQYDAGMWVRETAPGVTSSRCYMSLYPTDAFGFGIGTNHYMEQADTRTTLAADLVAGQTVMKLASSANWNTTPAGGANLRNVIFWNYVDPGGKLWEPGTYSRNVKGDAYAPTGISGNNVTLRTAHTGATIPAGTVVGNGSAGGTYMYPVSNVFVDQDWAYHSTPVLIGGIHTNLTTSATSKFPAATATVRVGVLANRNGAGGTSVQRFAGLVFSDVGAAQVTADAAAEAARVADGKAVVAASAASLADGKAIVADGKAVAASVAAGIADGKAVAADGKAVTAQNAANVADGKAVTADGKAVTADGKAVTAQQAANVADGKAVTADGKAVTAQNAAGVAHGAANTADGKAVAAQGTATSALNMAGTKSTVLYSTGTPSGVGKRIDDLWRQRDGSNQIIGEWRWNGGTTSAGWIKTTLTSGSFSNLDAGLLTAGTLNAARIGANAIDAGKIATNAVTSDKIYANAVTAIKITAGAIETDKLATNAVTAVKILAGSIETDKLKANAVVADKIATNAITAVKILAGSIETDKLATNAVTAVKIVSGSIITDKLATDAVTAIKIKADAVEADKIKAGAVTTDKLFAGSVTALKIATNAVTADKIEANAVTANKVHAGAITAVKLDADAVTAGKIQGNAIDGMTITGATVRTAATGQRVQMDVDGLKAYAATGSVPVAHLQAEDGGLTLGGTLSVNPGSAIRAGDSTSAIEIVSTPDPLFPYGEILFTGRDEYTSPPSDVAVGGVVGASIVQGISIWGRRSFEMGLSEFGLNGKLNTIALDAGDPSSDSPNPTQSFMNPEGTTWVEAGRLNITTYGEDTTIQSYGGNVNLHDLRNPTAPTDAATKGYVDSLGYLTRDASIEIWPQAGNLDLKSWGHLRLESDHELQVKLGGGITFWTNGDYSNRAFVVSAAGNIGFLRHTTSSGSANMYMASSGWVYRSTSIRSAKVDIQPLEIDPKTILGLPSRIWIDRGERELWESDPTEDEPQLIPGFIVDEVEDAGLGQFVTYEPETGNPTGVAYDRISAAIIPYLVQVEERLNALEGDHNE